MVFYASSLSKGWANRTKRNRCRFIFVIIWILSETAKHHTFVMKPKTGSDSFLIWCGQMHRVGYWNGLNIMDW